MSEKNKEKVKIVDEPLKAIPLDQRQHWLTPMMIFGGLEFCIPVLMVGSMLIGAFGMVELLPVLFVSFIVIQWAGNALNGYMGAKTGRSSSVLARSSFGADQSRFIIALVIFIVSLGWWAVQTAVAGNAICAMLGIDYLTNKSAWALITIIVGLIFAIPSIIGYSSMKWTDYVAVPAGLLLCIVGIVLAFRTFGWETIRTFEPAAKGSMTFLGGVSLIVSLNVSQWVIAADYTRYAKPRIKDNIIIPLGIIAIGFPLIYIGAIMAIGQGTADIVQVMTALGFPFWGFLVLWLSTWTSQLVNNYSMGLSLSNLLNISSPKGRSMVTLIGTIVAIIIALSGILNHFMNFLYLTALFYPSIAGVLFVDFFINKQKWTDHKGWNWMATIALIVGIVVGYYTTYVNSMGLPAVQSLAASALVFYIATKIKANVAPDNFTPKSFLKQ